MSFEITCARCSYTLPIHTTHWKCPSCGGILLVKIKNEAPPGELLADGKAHGLWKYWRNLPFSQHPVSLGEGDTPVVRRTEGRSEVLFKLEFISPTGSFKDRGASVSLTRVRAIGAKCVVEDSTGNAGIAASAYSASAGIKARVYVPRDAPAAKRELIRACGAEVVETATRREASERSMAETGDGEIYIGHTWDPFYIEGMKTVAFETFEGGYSVDTVISPVASGTLLLGIHKGYEELAAMGCDVKIPRICGVQWEGCSPIREALHGQGGTFASACTQGSTLADGIRIADPPRKREIVNAVRKTGGDVFVVSDDEIARAFKELLRIGIIAEPTSATAYAAFKKNQKDLGSSVLMPLTGSGIKNAEKIPDILGRG